MKESDRERIIKHTNKLTRSKTISKTKVKSLSINKKGKLVFPSYVETMRKIGVDTPDPYIFVRWLSNFKAPNLEWTFFWTYQFILASEPSWLFPIFQDGGQNRKWPPAKLKYHISLAVEVTDRQMRYQIRGFWGQWNWFRARYLAYVTHFQDGVQNPTWPPAKLKYHISLAVGHR